MYALGLSLSAAATLPYFRLGQLDVGLPIQAFGVIVAIGVLIGASLLRRYAEWHGFSDDHIRGLTGWVTVTGFIGAHVFDVLFYQWDDFVENPALIFMIWKGIASYGGFLGGAMGWWFYVWWKRLPMREMADITVIGLLVAFSIGRIGCTVVSDHVGAAVANPDAWYAGLAMDYPRALNVGNLAKHYPHMTGEVIKAWNLGLIEFMYLVPVNTFILWLSFRKAKPNGTDAKTGRAKFIHKTNAGMATVLTGVLYAPIRFFLEFLRPTDTDPRYIGMTFAQWCSIAAFTGAAILAYRIVKNGKPSEPVAETAGEAQRQLKMAFRESDEEVAKDKKKGDKDDKAEKGKASAKNEAKKGKDIKMMETLPEDDDEELAKEALAAGKKADKDEEKDEEKAEGKADDDKKAEK